MAIKVSEKWEVPASTRESDIIKSLFPGKWKAFEAKCWEGPDFYIFKRKGKYYRSDTRLEVEFPKRQHRNHFIKDILIKKFGGEWKRNPDPLYWSSPDHNFTVHRSIVDAKYAYKRSDTKEVVLSRDQMKRSQIATILSSYLGGNWKRFENPRRWVSEDHDFKIYQSFHKDERVYKRSDTKEIVYKPTSSRSFHIAQILNREYGGRWVKSTNPDRWASKEHNFVVFQSPVSYKAVYKRSDTGEVVYEVTSERFYT